MGTTRIVATVLPAGLEPAVAGAPMARFSVHFAPRLTPATVTENVLSAFTELLHWPLWAPTNVGLEFRDASEASLGIFTGSIRLSPAPDAGLWNALFTSTMPVEPFDTTAFQGKFSASKYRTFPASALHDWQQEWLSNLLIDHETTPPSPTELGTLLGPTVLVSNTDRAKVVLSAIDQAYPQGAVPFGKVVPSGPGRPLAGQSDSVLADHLQLLTFLEPRTSATYMAANPTLTPPTVDFHRAMALLADHPTLLRKLGLVMDFDLVGSVPSNARFVRVVPDTFGNLLPLIEAPDTVIDPGAFLAIADQGSDLTSDRMVDLSTTVGAQNAPHWKVVSLDVEGTGVKTAALAHTVSKTISLSPSSGNTPATLDTPAPRHGGLRLLRTDRAAKVVSAFQRSADRLGLPVAGDAKLFLDDLLRGYRVDVWDATLGAWHTLSARDRGYLAGGGSFSFSALDSSPLTGFYTDEAVVSTAVTSTADHTAVNPDMFVGESLFEWSGWSLATPRPGKSLASNGSSTPVANADSTSPELGMTVKVTQPAGTLPRLRFGRLYRFRLRTADLAGNGPTLVGVGTSLGTAGHPTDLTPYLRYDPVPSPVLLQQAPITEGETLTTWVARSHYLETEAFAPFTGPTRHVVPPSATAHTVEMHGALDPLPAIDSYALLTQRDGQQMALGASPAWMPNPYTGVLDPSSTSGTPVLYFTAPVVQPPWLVDPMSTGMRLAGGGTSNTVTFDPTVATNWYDARGWRVIMVPSAPGSSFGFVTDGPNRIIEVHVPQGEQFDVALSSTPNSAMIDHLAASHLLSLRAPVDLAARQARILAGVNRQVTPPNPLFFVHAVKVPLSDPSVDGPSTSVTRAAKSTAATFAGSVNLHPKSTGRIDIAMTWKEPIDTLGNAPTTHDGAASLPHLQVPYPAVGNPTTEAYAGLRQEFGDTKHRKVLMTAMATTRYASYFLRSVDILLGTSPTTLIQGSETGVQQRSVRVVDTTSTRVLEEGTDFVVDYTAGTIAALGTYSGNVQVRFVPTPVSTTTVPGAEATVHVPASAPPLVPLVADVVPTFDDGPWSWYPSPRRRLGHQRTRDGRVLRIYLDRPWFTSGEDEVLGVVLAQAPSKAITIHNGVTVQGTGPNPVPDPIGQHYTSAWGRDPLVMGDATPTALNATNFPLAFSSPIYGKWAQNQSVPGTSLTCIVVPHQVAYDTVRHQWYADVAVNLGTAYRPFVRLALVRFQPYAIAGAHVSPVVLVDAAQLSPNRTMIVTGTGSTRSVTLRGPGYATANRPLNAVPVARRWTKPAAQVQVQVQSKPTTGPMASTDPDVGWLDVPNRLYNLARNPNLGADRFTAFSAAGINITVPAGSHCRLLVREYEVESHPVLSTAPRRRLVFADSYVLH
jgi:hypothetical protein